MRDLYKETTDKIIQSLEKGVGPWIRPWKSAGSLRNAITNNPYKGSVNLWLLTITMVANGYKDPRFLTYNQARNIGGYVKKGEQGTVIVFMEPQVYYVDSSNQKVDESRKNEDNVSEKVWWYTKHHVVFNVEQCEGLDIPSYDEMMSTTEITPDPSYKVYLEKLCPVNDGSKAAYIPSLDILMMPPVSSFVDAGGYCAILYHEMVHATGHVSRCNRDMTCRFGSTSYAMEELVAELGSAFLCERHCLEGMLQHAEYIQSWIKVLKKDKYAIFTASRMAKEAVEWLS